MPWFGQKKPTQFDEAQDKALKQLMNNQTVLIKNNAAFIKTDANHSAWIKNLDARLKKLEANNQALIQHIQVLEAEAKANKQRDEQLAARFKNLGSVMANESETAEG